MGAHGRAPRRPAEARPRPFAACGRGEPWVSLARRRCPCHLCHSADENGFFKKAASRDRHFVTPGAHGLRSRHPPTPAPPGGCAGRWRMLRLRPVGQCQSPLGCGLGRSCRDLAARPCGGCRMSPERAQWRSRSPPADGPGSPDMALLPEEGHPPGPPAPLGDTGGRLEPHVLFSTELCLGRDDSALTGVLRCAQVCSVRSAPSVASDPVRDRHSPFLLGREFLLC